MKIRYKKNQTGVFLLHSTHYSYCYKHIPKKNRINRETFLKINKRIFEKAYEYLYTERDGVLLDGMGYFFNFMTPDPVGNKFHTSVEIMGRKYYSMFRTIGQANPFYDYSMSYNIKTQENLIKRVRKKQLYTFCLSLLLSNRKIEVPNAIRKI